MKDKTKLPHKISIRLSDEEKDFLDSMKNVNSAVIRRALALYKRRIDAIRREFDEEI